ncbi:MAG: transporter [Opitutae bacterium]|nr:transporter [Opitutae bacterium]
MKKLTLFFISLLLNFSVSTAHEGPWSAARPDGHAPISVMGDHMHAMGEWMLSYRYMTMEMEGLLDGSNDITASDANSTYGYNKMMLPKSMTMDMHMFGAMHAISDKWTLMAMLNYLDNEMIMQGTSMGKMESNGIGDIKLAGLYDLARWDDGRRAHLSVGLSAPTGSIDEKHSNGSFLGYGMQLGSGTWDFHPAITYLGQTENYSYGAQLAGIIRIGENDQGYTLGDRFEAGLWGARKITESLSASLKLDYSSQEEVDGSHSGITNMQKMMSPANRPDHHGRDITTLGLGLNYYFQNGGLKGHRLAAEWETPLDQKVNGVQLELDSTWTLGWQYAW